MDEERSRLPLQKGENRDVELHIGLVHAIHVQGAREEAEAGLPAEAEAPIDMAGEIAENLSPHVVGGRSNVRCPWGKRGLVV